MLGKAHFILLGKIKMGILQIPTQVPAQVGVFPSTKFMVTTDNLATLTTAAYLNQVSLESNPISSTDVLLVLYSFNQQSQSGTFGIFTVSISNLGVITLVSWANPGDVLLPVVSNHIAQFNGTTGQIYDGSAPAVHGGNIQAGLSGTAGTLASFPATAARGSLIITGVANTGNTNTTISNVAMGQASVVSIPDPANAAGRFMVGATATPFVNGNFPAASGTGGLMVDSGAAPGSFANLTAANTFSGAGQIILAKANGTEAANAVTASGNAGVITTSSLTTAGGATYAVTWTNTKITTTSVIGLTIQGGSNNATNNITFTCAPGSGTATFTIFNNTAATSLNGTLLIGYSVL
jgi:hypothetical protein